MWKDFFFFSKRERQGLLVLIALIAGVFLGKFLFTPKETPIPPIVGQKVTEEMPGIIPVKTSTGTVPSLPHATTGRKPDYSPSGSGSKTNQPVEKRSYYQSTEKTSSPSGRNPYPASEKFTPGTVIELNASDTLQLMKIPGIGMAFAKRIAGYRSLLGGFYRLEQLQEVYGMYVELYEKMIPFLRVDSNEIIPIQVNIASLDKLKFHPYINFYQAKAIVEMRKKKGRLNDINEFHLLEEFTEDDLKRLKHYLAF